MKENNHFGYKIFSKKTIKKMEQKMNLLGKDSLKDAFTFLSVRILFSITLFIVLLIFTHPGYIIAPIIIVLFYIFYEKIELDLQIKKRGKKLEEEAIFFFEVLSLTLESNRNLKKAIELTANNIDSELAKEFKYALTEIKLGKSFTESLHAMKNRIPSDTINNIILNLTQSNMFGLSIKETLNNQIDYLREKKLLETKAEIAKLPTKISIISVIFFLPIILLIILSPVVMKFFIG